jgi:hypothetical protein
LTEDDVVRRLAKLESEVGRWRLLFAGLALSGVWVGCGVVGGTPQGTFNRIVVKEIAVEDQGGREIILLGRNSRNDALLRIGSQKVKFQVTASTDSALLRMGGENTDSLNIYSTAGEAQIHVGPSDGTFSHTSGVNLYGSRHGGLADIRGPKSADLPPPHFEGAVRRSPILALYGGSPEIILRDASGAMRAVLGSTELQSGTGSEIRTPPGSLALFDSSGSVVFRAPEE